MPMRSRMGCGIRGRFRLAGPLTVPITAKEGVNGLRGTACRDGACH